MKIVQEPFRVGTEGLSAAIRFADEAMGLEKSLTVSPETGEQRLAGGHRSRRSGGGQLARMRFQMFRAEQFGADRFISVSVGKKSTVRRSRGRDFCPGCIRHAQFLVC
jgi:hypothetical protein